MIIIIFLFSNKPSGALRSPAISLLTVFPLGLSR